MILPLLVGLKKAQEVEVVEIPPFTFEIETIDEMVRLTVTHDQLESGSDMLRGISEGWPRVLSSLKSLLETGRPLNTWAGKKA